MQKVNAFFTATLLTLFTGTLAQAQVETLDNFKSTNQSNGDNFGGGLANLKDLNNDNIDEYIVGASNATTGFSNTGQAILYDGSTRTEILKINGTFTGQAYGSSVASAGDVNADGTLDFAIGAAGSSSGKGEVYIYSGAAALTGQEDLLCTYKGERNFDSLGSKAIQLIDSSGNILLALSAPCHDPQNKGYCVGKIYTVNPTSEFAIYGKGNCNISRSIGSAAGTNKTNDTFGSSLASGDFNGDGVEDIAAGAPLANSSTGYVRIFSGSTFSGSNAPYIAQISGQSSTDQFGKRITNGHDLNPLDTSVVANADEIIIGAPFANIGTSTDAGAIYAYTLSTNGSFVAYNGWNGSNIMTGDQSYDQAGFSIATLKDPTQILTLMGMPGSRSNEGTIQVNNAINGNFHDLITIYPSFTSSENQGTSILTGLNFDPTLSGIITGASPLAAKAGEVFRYLIPDNSLVNLDPFETIGNSCIKTDSQHNTLLAPTVDASFDIGNFGRVSINNAPANVPFEVCAGHATPDGTYDPISNCPQYATKEYCFNGITKKKGKGDGIIFEQIPADWDPGLRIYVQGSYTITDAFTGQPITVLTDGGVARVQ